jgi:post-segregation antitoxin (ccd killing protein)
VQDESEHRRKIGMTTITIGRNGVEFIHTNVMVPRNLRDLAKERGVSLSKTLKEALEQKLQEHE